MLPFSVFTWIVLILLPSQGNTQSAGALTIVTAELKDPYRGPNGDPSHGGNCINDDSTYGQLGGNKNWLIVTLQEQAQITKVEIYAPDSETPQTAIKNARIYVKGSTGRVLCGVANLQTQSGILFNGVNRMRYKVNCQGSPSGNEIHIQSSRNSNYMKVARVVIFGIDGAAAPAQIINEENVGDPAVLERRDDGVKVWKPEIKEPVPFEVLEELGQKENAVETPIGYFAYAGYVDYSLGLDTNAEETKPDQPNENQTKPNFGQNDLQTAVSSFLRFNGFVEDGEITDEMIEFMQKERCGNADLAIGQDEDKCTDESSKINTPANQKALVSFLIPGRESTERAEPDSYYLEVDVKFNNVRNGRSRSIFLGFNYQAESANGGDKPLEIVALRFLNNKLCVQFLTLFDGQFVSNLVSKETVLDSCYTPNSNEEKTLSFKVRLDVYKNMAGILGVASLSIKGKEVAKNVYKTGIISSAVVMRDQGDIEVTLSRICKRWKLSDDGSTRRIKPTRRKRFAISKHKWETAENLIRFNFQNYSTALGQEGTRTGVIDALQLFSDAAGFNFQEVVPTATAEIVFMFIKGFHADQKTFHGKGVEKAHAFVPTHSEVHFNDFETFTTGQADRATSMLYVAAHEIGHALGILHSPQVDALMKAGYPLNAFSFQHLHDDDVRAVKTLYPELSGTGRLEKLSTVAKETKYTPKIPFPTECYSHIDAALQVKEFAFIVSGPTIWKMRKESDGWSKFDGYPKRVTSVFQQAIGGVEAIFKVEAKSDITKFSTFVLHGYNLISRYNILLRDNAEPLITISWSGKERNSFLTKGRTTIDQTIKAAFTFGDKTILVADDLQSYFELSWRFRPKDGEPLLAGITKLTDMNKLFGRSPPKAFNAAMTFKVVGEDKENIYQFRKDLVYQKEPFPINHITEGVDATWDKVPDHFKIAGWCPINW